MATISGATSPSSCPPRATRPGANSTAEAAGLTGRFRTALEALTGRAPDPGRRLGLAVSGGPDSLALLLLAHGAYPGAVAAATVDHGLRPEAADEARLVASYCAELGVPHATLEPAQPIGGNLQSEARKARYGLLGQWREKQGLGWVATAHHADDQLETVLMRLLRGSGVDGLAAIRPVNGAVVRPLLGMRRSECEALVADHGWKPVRDPANDDPRFDRARLRKAIAGLPDFEPGRLARSASALAGAAEALDWLARREAESVVREANGDILLAHTAYPHDLLRRLVTICLELVDPGVAPRGPALDAFVDALARGETRTLGAVLGEPAAGEGRMGWRFRRAPPRKTG